MIEHRYPDEVSLWFVIFHRDVERRWVRAIPGRFKHVSAVGYSAASQTWVVYDVSLRGTRLVVLPEGAKAQDFITRWMDRADVLQVDPAPLRKPRLFAGFWCVPAMRSLLGVPGGTLRPTGFWRDCLRNGAKVVSEWESPAEAVAEVT